MSDTMYDKARFRYSGDRALLVQYGQGVDLEVNDKVRRMAELIRSNRLPGIQAVVPSYCTLSVVYDPLLISPAQLQDQLHGLEKELARIQIAPPRTVEIPVCYGGDLGPDIAFVARHNSLTVDEVVQIHSTTVYHIYAVGFAPGFCYLGGLDAQLRTPRLETPRTLVPAGSVGIAENQTGVYPLDSPGGWRLIGRTPLRLFAPERMNPFLYQAGDKIRFTPISREAYGRMCADEAA
jgi:inhibitor of KinA